MIVGGHSVADEEVKYGMAVTGVIDPQRIIRNVGARPGDALLLTKALGTGILMTAFKRDRLGDQDYRGAVASMVELNASAAAAMLHFDVHAATDITGFGLVGHGVKMAAGSGVTLRIEESDLPLLGGTLDLCRQGMIPGGGRRNREFYGGQVKISDEVAEEISEIVFDPQTSGGLLIALSEPEALRLLKELHRSGSPEAAIVGCVINSTGFALEVY
jgi:selenide, water dikinase